jgi:hypothetical protein
MKNFFFVALALFVAIQLTMAHTSWDTTSTLTLLSDAYVVSDDTGYVPITDPAASTKFSLYFGSAVTEDTDVNVEVFFLSENPSNIAQDEDLDGYIIARWDAKPLTLTQATDPVQLLDSTDGDNFWATTPAVFPAQIPYSSSSPAAVIEGYFVIAFGVQYTPVVSKSKYTFVSYAHQLYPNCSYLTFPSCEDVEITDSTSLCLAWAQPDGQVLVSSNDKLFVDTPPFNILQTNCPAPTDCVPSPLIGNLGATVNEYDAFFIGSDATFTADYYGFAPDTIDITVELYTPTTGAAPPTLLGSFTSKFTPVLSQTGAPTIPAGIGPYREVISATFTLESTLTQPIAGVTGAYAVVKYLTGADSTEVSLTLSTPSSFHIIKTGFESCADQDEWALCQPFEFTPAACKVVEPASLAADITLKLSDCSDTPDVTQCTPVCAPEPLFTEISLVPLNSDNTVAIPLGEILDSNPAYQFQVDLVQTEPPVAYTDVEFTIEFLNVVNNVPLGSVTVTHSSVDNADGIQSLAVQLPTTLIPAQSAYVKVSYTLDVGEATQTAFSLENKTSDAHGDITFPLVKYGWVTTQCSQVDEFVQKQCGTVTVQDPVSCKLTAPAALAKDATDGFCHLEKQTTDPLVCTSLCGTGECLSDNTCKCPNGFSGDNCEIDDREDPLNSATFGTLSAAVALILVAVVV